MKIKGKSYISIRGGGLTLRSVKTSKCWTPLGNNFVLEGLPLAFRGNNAPLFANNCLRRWW